MLCSPGLVNVCRVESVHKAQCPAIMEQSLELRLRTHREREGGTGELNEERGVEKP